MLVVLRLRCLVDRGRGANSGDHVLALGVDEVLAVKDVFVVSAGIAAEGDAGGAGVSHISEDHGLHVDRGAPHVRNPLDLAVQDRPRAVPGGEDGTETAPELLLSIIGEGLAEHLPDELLHVLA